MGDRSEKPKTIRVGDFTLYDARHLTLSNTHDVAALAIAYRDRKNVDGSVYTLKHTLKPAQPTATGDSYYIHDHLRTLCDFFYDVTLESDTANVQIEASIKCIPVQAALNKEQSEMFEPYAKAVFHPVKNSAPTSATTWTVDGFTQNNPFPLLFFPFDVHPIHAYAPHPFQLTLHMKAINLNHQKNRKLYQQNALLSFVTKRAQIMELDLSSVADILEELFPRKVLESERRSSRMEQVDTTAHTRKPMDDTQRHRQPRRERERERDRESDYEDDEDDDDDDDDDQNANDASDEEYVDE